MLSLGRSKYLSFLRYNNLQQSLHSDYKQEVAILLISPESAGVIAILVVHV
jgi:hypothetical protein